MFAAFMAMLFCSRARREVYIATGRNASPERIRFWQEQGFPVLSFGTDKMVEGAPLLNILASLGLKSIYLIAGPKMLDTIVRDKQLSRLYLTLTHQLMGGKDFRTLLTGSTLGQIGDLKLESLFLELGSPPDAGQFFAQFNLPQCKAKHQIPPSLLNEK